MKSRFLALTAALLIGLGACTLADDITPPPGYQFPTPEPTLAALHPSAPPSPARGAPIYVEKCAPCHGETGLGNGPMAAQLPVAVPVLSLREIAGRAAPAEWFAIVSQGRLERGMPGFLSLSEAERWDVLAYVYTLGTTAEELQRGETLFGDICAACHGPLGRVDRAADFTDQEFMAQLSGAGIYRTISGESPSHDLQGLAEDDAWALVAYVRALTFDLSPLVAAVQEAPTPTLESAAAQQAPSPTPEPVAVEADEEQTEAGPTPEPAALSITGTLTSGSGSAMASGLTVLLHQYNMNTGQEDQSLSGEVGPDGAYRFDQVPALDQMAYWVTVDYDGVTYESVFIVYDGATTDYDLPVTVYDSVGDYSLLEVIQVDVYFLFEEEGLMRVFELYKIINPGTRAVIFPVTETTIPFIRLPIAAQGVQFSPADDSAPFLPAGADAAIPPGADAIYGIVAVYDHPYSNRLELELSFLLPVEQVNVFVEQGVRLRSDRMEGAEPLTIQGITFDSFQAADLPAGEVLVMTLSGRPGTAAPAFSLDRQDGLLIGLGALGLALITAGVILYLRDRKRGDAGDEDDENDGEPPDALGRDRDAILDAIVVLDDQYRAGGLSREAYQKRRDELKERLRELV